MSKTKQPLDWGNLPFAYTKTDYRFQAFWEDGSWSEGKLITDSNITIHEGSTSLHYAQECFEGLKAQTAENGDVLLFRPEENAKRMQKSAERILMPSIPISLFMKGVCEVVNANYSWIPPHGYNASLYIRPLLIAHGDNLGLKSATKFEFRVLVSPVGAYFKSTKLEPIRLAVSEFHRVASQSTGMAKIGGNYAGGLLATKMAKEEGANEALYLDAKEHKYIEEAGSANILVLTKDKQLVTPDTDSILPSITRKSIMTLAKDKLNLTTKTRAIALMEEINSIQEMAACGTAAVLSPIDAVKMNNTWYTLPDSPKVGPIMSELRTMLVDLQLGKIQDDYNWIYKVDIT